MILLTMIIHMLWGHNYSVALLDSDAAWVKLAVKNPRML